MGDRLGIPDAVDISFYFWPFFKKITKMTQKMEYEFSFVLLERAFLCIVIIEKQEKALKV